MKMKIVLMAMFTLVLAVAAISAQDRTANFAGSWTLDASKSKLDERMRIESMTLNVTQTDKELKVETKTKRAPRPEGETGGSGQGRGGMGRGGFGGGDGTTVYSLDGKETKVEQETSMGKFPVTYKANLEKGGKLNLSSSRTISGQMGEMTITTKETWQLSEDGKVLTIKRETETPRGAQSSEMVFTKN
jgi:hypothetical protein